MNGVRELQEKDFKGEVLDAGLPVLVDFYAPWCGPCRALAPALEGIAKAYDSRVRVAKVNVDDCPGLASRYGIRGVPTLLFFKEGEEVDRVVGLPSAGALRTKLESHAAAPAAK